MSHSPRLLIIEDDEALRGRLEEIMREAGFELIETGTFDGAPESRFIVARKV